MIRSIFLAVMLAFVGPVAAQVPVQPIMGLAGGSTGCLGLTVRDPSNASFVSLGCLDTGTHTFRPVPQMFGSSATPSPDNTTLTATYATNAIGFGLGNSVLFCPPLSCVTSPTSGHQRTSALFASTTAKDGEAEEQTVAILMTINKGFAKTWATSTAFAANDNIKFQDARNSVYRARAACTSASSGTGPTGKLMGINDGSCVWDYINDAAIDAKLPLYVEANIQPGAGATWSAAFNSILASGVIPSFHAGFENDFTNNSGSDCVIGVANCLGMWINMGGSNKSTAGLLISSPNTSTFASAWGLRLQGTKLASNDVIQIDATAPVGIGFGDFLGAAFSIAALYDVSTGPAFIQANGPHTVATINDTSSAPTVVNSTGSKSYADIVLAANAPKGIEVRGTKTIAGISDLTTSPSALATAGTYSLSAIFAGGSGVNGLAINGTWTGAQIAAVGFTVGPAGVLVNTAIPTSCSGQPSGTYWKNGTAVNVCP